MALNDYLFSFTHLWSRVPPITLISLYIFYKTIKVIDAVNAKIAQMVIYFVLFREINWWVFYKHTHVWPSQAQVSHSDIIALQQMRPNAT